MAGISFALNQKKGKRGALGVQINQKEGTGNPVLIDRDQNLESVAQNMRYPAMSYQIDTVTSLGMETEKKRLELLDVLVSRRKKIRDFAISRIEDLIVFCDNRILDIGDEFKLRGDPDSQRAASLWQKTIIELEQQKTSEYKEMFRDALFLRNEWIKSILTYNEEKKLGEIMRRIESESEENL